MQLITITIFIVFCCYVMPCIVAKEDILSSEENHFSNFDQSVIQPENEQYSGAILNRQKRTLLLKKKLIGAGLLGFGLGVAKG